jgi:adenosylmethionine-8-amino-7-oxononanoate aminotransferase
MALENSYHGETTLALSVSDLGLYRRPYEKILIDALFLRGIPYVKNSQDPLWNDCSDFWPAIEKQLNQHAAELTAIIVEPILQGASGMLIYSQDFLKRLRKWTQENNVHLIADEIMTGFGRTGRMFAYQHSDIEPDFLCLGKGITSGFLPLSVVLLTNKIYELFYHDYAQGKNFLHSHTFSGNALAVAVALEFLKILTEEDLCRNVTSKQELMLSLMQEISDTTGKFKNLRSIGAVVAADLISSKPRMGFNVYQQAVKLGALLRPLGNTIYWLPPLNIDEHTLRELQVITLKAIQNTYNKSEPKTTEPSLQM